MIMFDPTKPVALTEIDANFLRDQFNALKALIDARQNQINTIIAQVTALSAPVLAFDAANDRWSILLVGPTPSEWQIWKRCDTAPVWAESGELANNDLPCSSESVLSGDEVWWQIKFIGLDENNQPVTPFSNVVSSPNAPG